MYLTVTLTTVCEKKNISGSYSKYQLRGIYSMIKGKKPNLIYFDRWYNLFFSSPLTVALHSGYNIILMKSKSSLHIFIWFTVSILAWVDDAHAYLDPGTGSMLFQALIAAVTGGIFLIKTYWSKIKLFFSRKKD